MIADALARTRFDGDLDPQACRAALGDVAWEPGVAKPDPILVVDSVVRRFGGLTAVDVDHLEVQRGVITAFIGPNGAGKTTLFNLITNFDKPDTGTLESSTVTIIAVQVPAHRIANYGHGAHVPADQVAVQDELSSTT
jgi:neutral amino acid transport system ATP-binding protein